MHGISYYLFFGPGEFRQSSFWVLLWGCGSVLSGVHSRALGWAHCSCSPLIDLDSASAFLVSIAALNFLVPKEVVRLAPSKKGEDTKKAEAKIKGI
jgi:hypothetical protein